MFTRSPEATPLLRIDPGTPLPRLLPAPFLIPDHSARGAPPIRIRGDDLCECAERARAALRAVRRAGRDSAVTRLEPWSLCVIEGVHGDPFAGCFRSTGTDGLGSDFRIRERAVHRTCNQSVLQCLADGIRRTRRRRVPQLPESNRRNHGEGGQHDPAGGGHKVADQGCGKHCQHPESGAYGFGVAKLHSESSVLAIHSACCSREHIACQRWVTA